MFVVHERDDFSERPHGLQTKEYTIVTSTKRSVGRFLTQSPWHSLSLCLTHARARVQAHTHTRNETKKEGGFCLFIADHRCDSVSIYEQQLREVSAVNSRIWKSRERKRYQPSSREPLKLDMSSCTKGKAKRRRKPVIAQR